MPAAGAKGTPKNPRELKDDNNSSREEKLVLDHLKISRFEFFFLQFIYLFPPKLCRL